MGGPDHGRKVTQLARAMAGTGAVGCPAIPWHTDDADIHLPILGWSKPTIGRRMKVGTPANLGS